MFDLVEKARLLFLDVWFCWKKNAIFISRCLTLLRKCTFFLDVWPCWESAPFIWRCLTLLKIAHFLFLDVWPCCESQGQHKPGPSQKRRPAFYRIQQYWIKITFPYSYRFNNNCLMIYIYIFYNQYTGNTSVWVELLCFKAVQQNMII